MRFLGILRLPSISMRYLAVLAPRLGQQWIGFWPSFDRPRFLPARSERQQIFGHRPEQSSLQSLQGIQRSGPRHPGAVLPECVDHPFETHPLQISSLPATGLYRHDPNHIVGDQGRQEFLDGDVRTMGSQMLHLHRRLDVPKRQLQRHWGHSSIIYICSGSARRIPPVPFVHQPVARTASPPAPRTRISPQASSQPPP